MGNTCGCIGGFSVVCVGVLDAVNYGAVVYGGSKWGGLAMICPIMSRAVPEQRDVNGYISQAERFSSAECEWDRCAWFDSYIGRCSIAVIASELQKFQERPVLMYPHGS